MNLYEPVFQRTCLARHAIGLTDIVRQDLPQFAQGQRPLGRLLWGPYGQGKTHMLTTIEHVALDLGFAVSRVSLCREVFCHHLLNFYGRVVSQIRTPDSKMIGLARALSRKTFNNLLETPITQQSRYVHPLPAIAVEEYLLSTGEEQELLYGNLTGIRLTMTEIKRIHRLCPQEALPCFDMNFRARQHGSAYVGNHGGCDRAVWL